jgi:hypothetical protein
MRIGHSARGAVVAGLGIAIAMSIGMGGTTAYATEPSIDGTPSNPIVAVDQGRTYAPGDTVKVDVSQTVGTERYSKFVLSDVIDSGVLDVTNDPAHVYRISPDGTKTEVNGAGTYSYDAKTKVLSFAFSKDYLNNHMAHDGKTTYVLEYTLKVTDASAIKKVSGGADNLDMDVSAASTIAVAGHDAYSKGATGRTIDIDADAKPSKSADSFNPITYITGLVSDMTADHSADYDVVATNGNRPVTLKQANASKSHVRLAQVADSDIDPTAQIAMKFATDVYEFTKGTDGGLKTITDANGNVTGYTYQETAKTPTSGAEPLMQQTVKWTFNIDSNVTDVTPDGTEDSEIANGPFKGMTLYSYGKQITAFNPAIKTYKVPSTFLQKSGDSSSSDTNASNENTNSNDNKNANENANSNTNANANSNDNKDASTDVATVATLKLDKDTVEPGGSTTGTLTIASEDGKTPLKSTSDITVKGDTGVTISDVKQTNTPETDPTSVTVTFTATADESAYGKTLTITGGQGTTTKTASLHVSQPAVNGALTADKTEIETGQTVTFTAGATASNGTAKNVTRTVTIDAPTGSTIVASDNGTVNGNTVTWSGESGKAALATHTVKVTVPDTVDAGGKTVKASGTITGDNITETTAGGNPTVNVKANLTSGTLATSTNTIDAGDSFDVDVSALVTSGHVKNGKLIVYVSHSGADATAGTIDKVTADDGGVVTANDASQTWKVEYDLGQLTSKASKKIHVVSGSSASASGQTILVGGEITSDTTAKTELTNQKVSITKPSISGTISISNATPPSANDTIDFKVKPSVSDGNAKNAVTTVTLSGADGATITADNNGTVSGNVVTFPSVASANGTQPEYTVHVKLPDDGTMNGKKITATAKAKADNVAETQIGQQSATVQTPTVTLKTSATAVSTKAAVNGKTSDSEGGTEKADGKDAGDSSSKDKDASKDKKTDATKTNDSKASTDGKGGTDTSAKTEPPQQKDANLVINNGDEIEYNVAVGQTEANAHANGVTVKSVLDDYSAQNGVYIEPDSVKIMNGDKDVTNTLKDKITWEGSQDQPTGLTIELGQVNADNYTITYKASTGKASSTAMRGRTITNTTNVTGTNFALPDPAKVDVVIASAELEPRILTNAEETKVGKDVKYFTVITNKNKSDDKSSKSSIAKNVYAASAIDDYAASIGIAIDPSSLQILSVENGKATDITKNVTIKWDGTKGFSVDTQVNLAASSITDDDVKQVSDGNDDDARYGKIDHALVISYSASTANVNKDVFGENDITDSVITRADNATYAAANKKTRLVAADAPAQQDEQGGTIDDNMTQTGDAVGIAGIGAAIAAGIAGIVAFVRRKR